ncbi:arginine/lysine/ornithine decarboxylase [Staphylococcus pasteuri]|uniref:Arginine/lysine/ornithine decarboxylase n=2 Tax=Staphylococcus TaxID=1279 RepID=A0ABY1H5D6_9STAP|nr:MULTISPECIES: aminotransferase class V-fold PLP-dependent enzyme [Staphylococcus]ATH63505.1 lysine decarboxylase [Staphylococcus pasteuri]KKI53605.1 Arginine decarboxylase [Staphylococcus pasteuri]MCF7600922.1 aminotransferase class V-fold PLP-dependent enzyme [Staphylococcus pasteuri]MDI3233232.1 aminotransferase class V-fold PLP-dependent enzyme [Staphylococcus pasteuri]MDO6574792.1 aminotransferase class V-fold PLP-dependent enzyme [Staphylococcus pasteuri_A]
MNQPISNQLKNLISHQSISMHVPGHKNMTIGLLKNLDFKMDMTEISGLDDLHHPEEIILDSMAQFNKHQDYNAYLLINGTTSGILSVIQALAHQSGEYLIPRNVHKSVFHGLELAHQKAKFTKMKVSSTSHHYLSPQLQDLDLNNQKLAIMTYPNYYGETYDIQSDIELLHSKHIPVLIDEAHGAHFDLKGFPTSSLNYGADYVVQSYHKTLPALTMGSILYIHKDAPHKEEIKQYLSYFQTSSPSYLVMASLEMAHTFYEEYQSDIFFEKRKLLLSSLENKGFIVNDVDDPLKMLITYPGYSGYDIQNWFEKEHIYVELADDYQVLFVLPLWHQGDEYPFNILLEKINSMLLPDIKQVSHFYPELMTECGEFVPIFYNDVKWIDINDSLEYRLARHIIPYPPGVPILFKGEKITENMIKLMNQYQQSNMKVEGIKDNQILIKDE